MCVSIDFNRSLRSVSSMRSILLAICAAAGVVLYAFKQSQLQNLNLGVTMPPDLIVLRHILHRLDLFNDFLQVDQQ